MVFLGILILFKAFFVKGSIWCFLLCYGARKTLGAGASWKLNLHPKQNALECLGAIGFKIVFGGGLVEAVLNPNLSNTSLQMGPFGYKDKSAYELMGAIYYGTI